MSLADALERAASALPECADAVRPANGDPVRVLDNLATPVAGNVLAWLLAEEPEAGEELALAWADEPAGSDAIGLVDARALPKNGRKSLRRALHRLRSRGVAVERAEAPEVVARLPELDDDLQGALVSRPDPSGAQLVLRIEASPSGGIRIFQGAIDAERGILDFQAANTNRSQARALLRRLHGNPALGAVPVDPSALAALLERAAAAQPADRALPGAYAEWRRQVARGAEGASTPGEQVRAALPSEPTDARRAEELVEKARLGPWPPALDALRAVAEKVNDAARSQVVVGEQQRRAHLEDVIGDALEERYADPAGELTARRLEEWAYVAWKAGDEDDARAALAGAGLFRERPPRDNPVARALLTRAIAPFLEAAEEEDEESSSLLVRP